MAKKINFGTMFLFVLPVGEPQQEWDEDVNAKVWFQPKIQITAENWHEFKMQFLECRLSEWAKTEKYKAFDRKRLIGFEIRHIEKIVPYNTYEAGMLEMYLELLNSERSAESDNPKPQKTEISYQWQGNTGQDLPELLELLRDTHKLIHADATIEQFNAIFTGQPLHEITPVKWHNTLPSEVLFLMLQFMEHGSIKKESRMNYKRIESCFVSSTGQPFDCNWKNIKNGIERHLAQSKQELLKSIAQEF